MLFEVDRKFIAFIFVPARLGMLQSVNGPQNLFYNCRSVTVHSTQEVLNFVQYSIISITVRLKAFHELWFLWRVV